MKKYALLPLLLLVVCLVAPTQAAPTSVKLGPQWSKEIKSLFETLKASGPVDYFNKKRPSDEQLMVYAIIDVETMGRFSAFNGNFGHRIPGKYVADYAMKYFGRSIKPKSTNGYVYKNGYFLTQGSDGRDRGYVTADKLLKIKPNVYEVHLSWHSGDLDSDAPADVYLREKATLQRTAKGGKSRFIVTSYTKVSGYNLG